MLARKRAIAAIAAGVALISGLVALGQEKKDGPAGAGGAEPRSPTAHAGPRVYVRPEGPPAVADDWERPYPQLQQIGIIPRQS